MSAATACAGWRRNGRRVEGRGGTAPRLQSPPKPGPTPTLAGSDRDISQGNEFAAAMPDN